MKTRTGLAKILISSLLFLWLLSLSPALQSEEDPESSPAKASLGFPSEAKNVVRTNLSLRGKSIYAGDIPAWFTSYDSAGQQSVGVSQDYTNRIIDISEIPVEYDPWAPKIGVQLTHKNIEENSVSIRRRNAEAVFVNKDGIVFPKGNASIQKEGPFINVTFLSPRTLNVITLDGLSFQVSSRSRKSLETDIQKHEILLIKNVPKEPITLRISEVSTGKNCERVVFPMFRSASPGVLLYIIQDVTIGKSKGTDPDYNQ